MLAVPPPVLFTSAVGLWLDAAEVGTVMAPGGTVERWRDRSSHGHDALARSPAAAPAHVTLGGTSAIAFDGVDDQLRANALPLATSRTLFLVGASPGLSAVDSIATLASTKSCPPTNGGFAIGVLPGPATGSHVGTIASFSHHLRVDGASYGDMSIEQDRWFVASMQMFPDNTGPVLSLGSTLDGCQFGHVLLGEVIVLERGMGFGELTEVERYLAEKWHVPL